ncbi:hypothetical protein AAGV33_15875 [Flavobacterium sp. FBOR7N2.3]|uniref:Prolyl-tRNA synthetase n=1 Tax=Flavobacterium magnesitis TaxID=3138077 RepID=A0ABV4TPZ0_9FLAO
MKTNIFPPKEIRNYLYIGLLSLFMVSCGSYQNSSYYESDGIYGASANRNIERRNTNSDNYYRDYFNSLQNDSESPEVMTDIDKYSDFDSVDNDSYPSYAGWGNNQTGTIVNYWGMNSGFGWNNWGMNNWGWNNWGWNNWGMNYGFGWNNWGWNNWGMNYGFGWNNWGWNNWGWNNNYYYNRPYGNGHSSYAPGRRSAPTANSLNNSRNNSRNYAPTRSYSTSRIGTDRTETRRAPTFTNPRTYNSNRTQTTTTRRSTTPTQNNNSRQQQNSNYSRNDNYTPTRTYSTPSNSGSSGRSYGGGSGGGGSRSSGGGGRR